MESIWMVAGRDDAAFLNRFVKDFGERFAEEDGILHGAYGRRWRDHFVWLEAYAPDSPMPYLDQIDHCVELLKKNPDDRRVVIQMWNAECDLGAKKRDVPCNTQLYLRIVQGALDMTIMCRSNDIIWGAYGANAVHFSFLQEVMAAGIGCRVGKLYQMSNNWHGYTSILDKQDPSDVTDFYAAGMVTPRPIVENYEYFLTEARNFCRDEGTVWTNSFFPEVAIPMMRVHTALREEGAAKAIGLCHWIQAPDWQLAAKRWLSRRIK